MADYTGDPAGTNPTAPESEQAPTLDCPADGEELVAASVDDNPFKKIADELAWLKLPRAKAASYALKVQRWLNARLQERAGIDHIGFPHFPGVAWQENWRGGDSLSGTGTATFNNTAQRWDAAITAGGSGGSILVLPNHAVAPAPALGRVLALEIGGGASDVTRIRSESMCRYTTSNHIVLEWSMNQQMADAYDESVMCFGLGNDFADTAGFIGAVFYREPGDLFWSARTGDGTALGSKLGTATGTGGWARFRVEWHGSGVADNSANACRFFVNDALVATATANLPIAAASPDVFAFFGMKKVTGGTDIGAVYLRPVNYISNI